MELKRESLKERKVPSSKVNNKPKQKSKSPVKNKKKLIDSYVSNRTIPRMLEKYQKDVVPIMRENFTYRNIMEVPRVEKIYVNIGMGEAVLDKNSLTAAILDLTTITGQKPRENKAKKSIANFKLREGMVIGLSVTLRRDRMWDFFDRLVNIALPRIRDFRGISSKSFDGHGNYSLGLKEQVTFPEINYTEVDKLRGLQVTINTSAKTDQESKKLLELLGMPFSS